MAFDWRQAANTRPPTRVVVGLVAIAIVVCAIGAAIGAHRDARQREDWLLFKGARHCKAVAHRAPVTVKSVTRETKGPDTTTVSTTAAQTGWLCDDGVTRFVDD